MFTPASFMTSHGRFWEARIQSEKQFNIKSILDCLDYHFCVVNGNCTQSQANSPVQPKDFQTIFLR